MKINFPPIPANIRKRLLPGCLLLLALLLLCCALVIGLDPHDNRILPDVRVGGLDVGGLSPLEAYRVLDSASQTILEGTDLTVCLPEQDLPLSPADTRASLKTWRAVLAAYKVGRIGEETHAIGLAPYLRLDEKYIRKTLAEYAENYDTDVTPSQYQVTGNMPDLEIENQNSGNKPQTLELTMGLPTARLDQEDTFGRILAVYDSAFSAADQSAYVVDQVKVDILEEPEAPALQTIYDQLYIAAVDDTLDMTAHKPIPGAFGYHFDMEKAQSMVDQAEYGATLRIPMEFLEPDIYGEDVYYRDVLGYCETPHTKDENRNNNLRKACESMNGVVLQPGDVFSYNDTLGERTKERGYLRAGAYSGWELVQSYGGGICQGSSTIYCAALYADLEIVFRRNHGYAVSYIDFGLDATVNWGGPDFQFRNNTHFPIKIAAEVSDGFVKVTILGTEERDYYVEMESEASITENHIYAKSFKCKYDRQTDELISRDLEARSTYNR